MPLTSAGKVCLSRMMFERNWKGRVWLNTTDQKWTTWKPAIMIWSRDSENTVWYLAPQQSHTHTGFCNIPLNTRRISFISLFFSLDTQPVPTLGYTAVFYPFATLPLQSSKTEIKLERDCVLLNCGKGIKCSTTARASANTQQSSVQSLWGKTDADRHCKLKHKFN